MALETLEGEKMIHLVAKRVEVHPVQLSKWKKKSGGGRVGGGASGVNRAFGVDEASLDKVCAPLHAKIGTRWYNWTGSEKG